LEPTELLQQFQGLKRLYHRCFKPVSQRWKLTQHELDVLLFLANNPGRDTARDMVELRGLTKSHVALSVDHLTARGLLSQQTDPADRRRTHLCLHPAADPIVAMAQQAQQAFSRQLFQGLSSQELVLLGGLLSKIFRNVSEQLHSDP
jgi:DNA-binding MarR family transcriptional regulator